MPQKAKTFSLKIFLHIFRHLLFSLLFSPPLLSTTPFLSLPALSSALSKYPITTYTTLSTFLIFLFLLSTFPTAFSFLSSLYSSLFLSFPFNRPLLFPFLQYLLPFLDTQFLFTHHLPSFPSWYFPPHLPYFHPSPSLSSPSDTSSPFQVLKSTT